jgi:hypothetical protein
MSTFCNKEVINPINYTNLTYHTIFHITLTSETQIPYLFIYLFILNDAISSSGYIVSNDRTVSEYELERKWKADIMV